MSTQQQPPFQPPPSKYTPEEWKLLSELPWRVGIAVVLAGQRGVGEKLQGAMSAFTSDVKTAADFPQNPLIQGIIQERKPLDAKEMQRTFMGKAEDATQIKSGTLNACRQAIALLEQKASPQEMQEFKRWLMNIGEHVAQATSSGTFLGLGFGAGPQVTEEERQALRELAVALQFTG